MTGPRLAKINSWLRTALVLSGICFLGLVVTVMFSPFLLFIAVEGVLLVVCVTATLVLRWKANNELGL